MLKITCVSL